MPETEEENPRGSRYGRFLSVILALVDLILVNALFGVLCLIHPDVVTAEPRLKWVMVTVCYLPVMFRMTGVRVGRSDHIDRIATLALQAVGIHALFFVSVLSFLGADDFPVRYYVEFYAMMLVALPVTWIATRMVLKQLRNAGWNFSRVIIVGTNPTARRLHYALTNDNSYGYRVLGFFDKTPYLDFKGNYRGDFDRLEGFIRDHKVDEVFFTLSGENEDDLLRVIRITDDCMVKFHYVPKISPYVGRRFELSSLRGLPVLTPLVNPLGRSVNRAIKRAFDVAFSSVVLLFSPIIFIPVAIAVKLSSPGPIFFRQKRTGYKGREFNCLKFRTMRVNADADTRQATGDDPRKTKVGDFLRRTSIDELPQFINVWLGDMSVVGPRPHMLAHTRQYSELIDRYMIRHMVKPGITGWAQVCGYRGNTDELWKMQGRVDRDVWYIEHWSFMLDLKIVVKTVVNALRGESNAY